MSSNTIQQDRHNCSAWGCIGAGGCYSRLYRAALNLSWKDKVTNDDLFGDLLKVTREVSERSLSGAGHFHCYQEEAASTLVLWDPRHVSPGSCQKPKSRFSLKDTRLENISELISLMEDRKLCCLQTVQIMMGDCGQNNDDDDRTSISLNEHISPQMVASGPHTPNLPKGRLLLATKWAKNRFCRKIKGWGSKCPLLGLKGPLLGSNTPPKKKDPGYGPVTLFGHLWPQEICTQRNTKCRKEV